MPDRSTEDLDKLAERGVAAYEDFVRECRAIDLAWMEGRIHEYIDRKLDDERIAAGLEPLGKRDAAPGNR